MLLKLIRTLVVIMAVSIVSTVISLSQASTLPPITNTNTQQGYINEKGFEYPVYSLQEEDLIETGVLFVYNDHILNFFGGDAERLLEYINSSINYNNIAFANSNIPLKRVVSGLIHADEAQIQFWANDDTYVARLDALQNFQQTTNGQQLASELQYSYLVGLAGFEVLDGQDPIVGLSYLGSNVSWVSPYSNDTRTWSDRSLAHELGHNDGFRHTTNDHEGHEHFLARHDATGYKCGEYASVMHVTGTRTEPFFSDAEVSLHKDEKQEACGLVGEANSAQVYRDLANNKIRNSEDTFKNLVPTRAKTGVVSIQSDINAAVEGQALSFDVIFEGADKGDSVNVVVRSGDASLEDFDSKIVHVIHNGIDNVYSVTVATNTDSVTEDNENLSVELIFANGVRIDTTRSQSEGTIIDIDNTTTTTDTASDTAAGGSVPATTPVAANTVAPKPVASPTAANTASNSQAQSTGGGGGSFGIYGILLAIAVVLRKK